MVKVHYCIVNGILMVLKVLNVLKVKDTFTFKMATIASTCYTNTSNTTLTDGSNTTTTETEIDLLSDSEISDSSSFDGVNAFLSRFKAPRLSDLTRKRKIRRNPVTMRRKSKPCCSTDPKSITPHQRVKEFPDEPFIVSAGKLFCSACKEEISLKLSIINNHVKASKHGHGKQALLKKESRERDIAQALKKFDDENHPTGETLPEAQRVFRVKVIKSFLKAGVPLNKLEQFREVLEQGSYKLADKRGMYDIIPFVLVEEQSRIKAEICGRNISVIFDGTTRL